MEECRKARANAVYDAGLRANRAAGFAKICDLLDNWKYSLNTGDLDKRRRYTVEAPDFEVQPGGGKGVSSCLKP